MRSLDGKAALVTGATGGIGRAICRQLSSEGVVVVAVARTLSELRGLRDSTGAPDDQFFLVQADFLKKNGLREIEAWLPCMRSGLDILVHGAGFLELGAVEESSREGSEAHLSVNLTAPYELTRMVLSMLRERRGQVVFVNSSVCSQPAKACLSAYTASKWGLKALADSFREELNASGVRVLSIYPGRTATRMQEKLHAALDQPYRPQLLLQPEDVAQQIVNALKLADTAEVTDIYLRPHKAG